MRCDSGATLWLGLRTLRVGELAKVVDMGRISMLMVLAVVVVSCGSTPATDSSPIATEIPDVVSAPPSSAAAPDTAAPTSTDSPTTVNDSDRVDAVALRVGCPNGPFFPATVLDSAPELIADSSAPEIAEGIASFLKTAEGDFWPQSGYRVLEVVEGERATVVFPGSEEFPGLWFMSVEWTSQGWEWAGASVPIDCGLVIEPSTSDGGVVDWVIDPDSDPPGPDTTSLVLLATERGCAGGAPMGDRLNDPQVTMTADLVLIQLTVEPQTGDQTCPDNPAQPIDVQLPEPLGQRDVRDARATNLGDLDDVLNQLIADS